MCLGSAKGEVTLCLIACHRLPATPGLLSCSIVRDALFCIAATRQSTKHDTFPRTTEQRRQETRNKEHIDAKLLTMKASMSLNVRCMGLRWIRFLGRHDRASPRLLISLPNAIARGLERTVEIFATDLLPYCFVLEGTIVETKADDAARFVRAATDFLTTI